MIVAARRAASAFVFIADAPIRQLVKAAATGRKPEFATGAEILIYETIFTTCRTPASPFPERSFENVCACRRNLSGVDRSFGIEDEMIPDFILLFIFGTVLWLGLNKFHKNYERLIIKNPSCQRQRQSRYCSAGPFSRTNRKLV